jgi:hypothetical protein
MCYQQHKNISVIGTDYNVMEATRHSMLNVQQNSRVSFLLGAPQLRNVYNIRCGQLLAHNIAREK